MEGLVQGRIVHHVFQLESMAGTVEYAAIVSRVHDIHDPALHPAGSIEAAGEAHADGDVDLFSFMETRPVHVRNVPYSPDLLPNTWHWIEQ